MGGPRVPRTSAQAQLAILQLNDSALPTGRFAHSGGFEAWLEAHPAAAEADLAALIEAALGASFATLDGAGVALAHTAATGGDLKELLAVDHAVTARKLSRPARDASTLCGSRLTALAVELDAGGIVPEFAAMLDDRATPGNLAVAEGAIAAAFGISQDVAVLAAARSTASWLLSVAVRLGRLSARRAQVLLHALGAELARCATVALGVPRTAMRATTPELEIYAARHPQRAARLFIT